MPLPKAFSTSKATPRIYSPQAASIRDIYAYSKDAPLGGNIHTVVEVAGNPPDRVVAGDG